MLLTETWADVPVDKNLFIMNSSRSKQTVYMRSDAKTSRKTLPPFSWATVYVTGQKLQMKNASKSVTVEIDRTAGKERQ